MRRTTILGLGLMVLVGASGCDDEAPTSLGSDILGEDFETYVVVLEGESFLRADTTYGGIGTLNGVPFAVVANAFEGELFGRALFRVDPPETVTFEDSAGESISESDFTIVGGTLTLVLDERRAETGPAEFELLRVVEDWDAGTVSWELAADTGDVAQPWTDEGGTTGQLLGSQTWEGEDTLRIELDSAAVAVWTDSAAARQGGLIRTTTEGVRVRIDALDFAFNVRPESVDTIVPGGSLNAATTIVTPAPSAPEPSELRVGGVPIWRSALHFRPLGEIPIPCGTDTPGCTVPVEDVHINQATLLLQPVPVGSRRIERPMSVVNRAVLRAPGVPVSRSPLTASLDTTRALVPIGAFTTTPENAERVELPVTRFVRLLHLDPPTGSDPIDWLALLAESERGVASIFGYSAFGSLQSAVPPQLRLVVTGPVRREDS